MYLSNNLKPTTIYFCANNFEKQITIMVVISAQNETLFSTTAIHSQHPGFGMENIIESISNIFFPFMHLEGTPGFHMK